MSPEDTATLKLIRLAIRDSLQATLNMTTRASEHFQGTTANPLFRDLEIAIRRFKDDSPEMQALASAALQTDVVDPDDDNRPRDRRAWRGR